MAKVHKNWSEYSHSSSCVTQRMRFFMWFVLIWLRHELCCKNFYLIFISHRLHIRRPHLLEDAYNRIMSANKKDLQRGRLAVLWETEEGLDCKYPTPHFRWVEKDKKDRKKMSNIFLIIFSFSLKFSQTVDPRESSSFYSPGKFFRLTTLFSNILQLIRIPFRYPRFHLLSITATTGEFLWSVLLISEI